MGACRVSGSAGGDVYGFFQVFRVPLTGGKAEQVTFDPTDKTHPAYAPDGQRIAFTVFSYKAHFWLMNP